jgi:hypothetical protein
VGGYGAALVAHAAIPLLKDRPLVLCGDEHGAYYEIAMNDNFVCLLDAADLDRVGDGKWRVFERRWCLQYVIWATGNTTLSLHRVLTNAPKNRQVDHRDGSGLNNRQYNLRVCTQAQNNSHHHRSRGTKSGYRGVYPIGKRWYSLISTGKGKCISLGTFDTPEEAARAWDRKAIELRGEFTFLNFPNAQR